MHLYLRLVLFNLLCLIGLISYAQNLSITGKVVDSEQNPIFFANVILYNMDDTFVKGTSTNDNGTFELDQINQGSYFIKISFIGFRSFSKTITLEKNVHIETITLVEDSEILEQVTITAKKPTITRRPDRLTFNVENTALTQGSTLQVLKSTPGIIVSEGSINIKSSPATVYINNRRVQLTSNELIQLLESAPASSIKSVEVITNPPANYDADSGSVINIIMSKNLIMGYRGNIATNYTQGVFPRYNTATSHYFKNNKINLNLNYSYTGQKINRDNDETIDYLSNANTIDQIWESDLNRNTWSETHNLNLNFDYFLSDKTTLSLTSTGLWMPYFKYRIANNTEITDENNVFLSRFTADNLSRDEKFNIGTDLSLRTEFKNGSSLSINGHYTFYDYDRDQNVISNFFDSNNNFDEATEFNTIANQNTDIITAGIDYSLPINETSSFDTGMKFSNVRTNSSIQRLDVINGSEVINVENSNDFDYDETVFAAYANYTKSWDKWDIVLGLRVEDTKVEGVSPTLRQTNNQDYFSWFPNASILHNITDRFSLYGNYKRSIIRPNYTNLNPFTFFLNENTVVLGNPNLQPTFKDHFVVGTSFLDYFTIEAYYINYEGAINEIPRQDNDTNIIAFTPINFDKTVDYGFDFAFDYYPTEKWNLYFVTSLYNITEETDFGLDNVELSRWANYSILSNNITFLEDNSLNLNLTLTWVGKGLQGFMTVEDRLFSELSITKSIFKKKGVLSLSIEDIFNYQDEDISVRYLNQSNRRFSDIDNRFIRIGFSYKFGNTKLNTNERTTDEEQRSRLDDLD